MPFLLISVDLLHLSKYRWANDEANDVCHAPAAVPRRMPDLMRAQTRGHIRETHNCAQERRKTAVEIDSQCSAIDPDAFAKASRGRLSVRRNTSRTHGNHAPHPL
ncbi:hypothetical protein PUN4_230026 [Paraburkholderia unamae]|nr:hypothetical protein PUN4_230026 [Paraburkholderia unamae]